MQTRVGRYGAVVRGHPRKLWGTKRGTHVVCISKCLSNQQIWLPGGQPVKNVPVVSWASLFSKVRMKSNNLSRFLVRGEFAKIPLE